jgi:hypothetical protein
MNWDLDQLEKRKEELECTLARLLMDKNKNFHKIFETKKLIELHVLLINRGNGILSEDNLH